MTTRSIHYLLVGSAIVVGSFLTACSKNPSSFYSSITWPKSWHTVFDFKKNDKETAPKASEKEVEINATEETAYWWEQFHDDVLNGLVFKALKQNRDLQQAVARVQEARADRLGARANLLPQMGIHQNATRGNQGVSSNNQLLTLYETGFDASWEIDIFGRNRQALKAKNALLSAEHAGLQSVWLSLVAEVMTNYMEVRRLQGQIRVTEQNVEAQKSTWQLTDSQYQAGLVSDLDGSQAKSQYLSTAATVPLLQADLRATLYRLAALLGEEPGGLEDTFLQSAATIPSMPLDMVLEAPATVISSRPDVQKAACEFAASVSLKEVAVLDAFPKLSLSSLFGMQDSTLLPSQRIWSVGAQATLPLLNFGRIRSQIRAADARQQQAFLTYEQTVLEALQEIETNFVRYQQEQIHLTMIQETVASNRTTVALANERYKKGIASLLDVLTAERSLYDAESALATSQANVSKYLVAIYKSLGYGIMLPASESKDSFVQCGQPSHL